MRVVVAVYRFLYDFIIGDDWKIAAAVVAALALGVVLLAIGVPAGSAIIATAVLVAAGFTVALVVDVRHRP